MKICIGVLAVQGAFSLHRPHILAAGASYKEVCHPGDFENLHALILPGGESAVMLRLISELKLEQALLEHLKTKPVWGICAGAILMAKKVENPSQHSFGALDITIERNSYGRQIKSCEYELNGYRVSHIRAPRILSVEKNVKVMAKKDGDPVWVESCKKMVTTFHPELNPKVPSPWHQRLVEFALTQNLKNQEKNYV